MKAQEASITEGKKKGKGWKPIKNLNPIRKPLIAKKQKNVGK